MQQGLRQPLILVITPAWNVGASRVLQPPRFGASGCRAKGRSATRSDSQRSLDEPGGTGRPAWGWKPKPNRV